MSWWTKTNEGVRLSIRVAPRASRTEVAGLHGTALKIRLQAPPVDGAANEALIRFLADELDVSRSAISIESGQSGRNKILLIRGFAETLRLEQLEAP